jgi:MoxR-like ATPase
MTQLSIAPSHPPRRRRREPRPPLEPEPILAKIGRLLAGLDRSLVERSTHIRVALLALLAGHHVLLIGPPGTAKSQLARALCGCVREARFFEYLLSKFTHPDELFGPVSIPGLKEEDYRRLTDGYLPRVHVAFLDEIFKANSAILNSLLTLINERVFHHGKRRDKVPLLGVVGASNELPERGAGLEALYDRFLVRVSVPPIDRSEHFLRVSLGELPEFRPADEERLTVPEIRRLRELAGAVTVDKPVREALLRIRAKLQEASIEASDRRWRWAIELLRMSALTAGRNALSVLDLTLLEHCFGEPTDSEGAVRRCVREGLSASSQGEDLISGLKQEWTDLQAKPAPVALSRWRPEMLARVDGFAERCEDACAELDRRLERLEAEQEQTPWLVEVPPELAAGLLAARVKIQQYKTFVGSVRAKIAGYAPAALVHENLRRRLDPWGYSSVPVYIRLAGAGDWLGLYEHGSVKVTRQPDEDTPQLEIDDATAHSLSFTPELPALAQRLAEAAVKPLIGQPTHHLALQARRGQGLIEGCSAALSAAFRALRQQGVAPPGLPMLPEPEEEAKHAKTRA